MKVTYAVFTYGVHSLPEELVIPEVDRQPAATVCLYTVCTDGLLCSEELKLKWCDHGNALYIFMSYYSLQAKDGHA